MTAATVDLTSPITSSFSASRAWEQSSSAIRKFRVIDWAEVLAAKGSATAQNDTVDVIKIPAGSFVKDVIVRQLVAPVSTAAETMQVGDTTHPTNYIVSFDLQSAANTCVAASGTAIVSQAAGGLTITYLGGLYYASADAIRVTLNSSAAVTAGKTEFSACIIPLGAGLTI
jgi:hypothetical protein